ncbi:MAG TPA: hypothetical protein VN752_10370, partial [Solirubrobacterales bacterium]|nr:hypothetical protein [Solirubrobacterales bacterium]
MPAPAYMRVFQVGRRGIALGTIAVLASVAWPAAAESAAGPTFALKPASPAKLGYFVLQGRPGGT